MARYDYYDWISLAKIAHASSLCLSSQCDDLNSIESSERRIRRIAQILRLQDGQVRPQPYPPCALYKVYKVHSNGGETIQLLLRSTSRNWKRLYGNQVEQRFLTEGQQFNNVLMLWMLQQKKTPETFASQLANKRYGPRSKTERRAKSEITWDKQFLCSVAGASFTYPEYSRSSSGSSILDVHFRPLTTTETHCVLCGFLGSQLQTIWSSGGNASTQLWACFTRSPEYFET